MAKDFTKIKCVYINNDSYWIHEYILKQMSIFSLLFDESFDQKDVNINIDNYDKVIINEIIAMLYDPYIDKLGYSPNSINQLQIMIYLGLDEKIVNRYVEKISKNDNILDRMIESQYHECFNMIMKFYNKDIIHSDVIKYATLITKTTFPISFQIRFLQKLISLSFTNEYNTRSSYNWRMKVYVCGYNGMCEGLASYDPKMVYDHYNIQCESVIVHINNHIFTSLVVNDKEVANFTKNNDVHISISNHIAKVLLGVETI